MAPLLIFFFLLASTTAELTCSNQTVQDRTTNKTLDIFFRTLVDQSNSNKFDQTIVVNTAISVSGIYQCRANLSQTDCKTCVEKLTDIIPTQCKAATAKVVDCNMTYEVVRNHVIHSADGGQDYGGCIGAFVVSVVAIVVSMLLN